MKQTVVIRVSNMDGHKSIFGELDGEKVCSKTLKIAVSMPRVVSMSLKGDEKDQVEVKGDNIDSVKLAKILKKKVGHAYIVTVEEEKKEEPKVEYWPYNYNMPSYSYPLFYAPSTGGVTYYYS